jgi:predicted patatin/cPLA2 family phospholipase
MTDIVERLRQSVMGYAPAVAHEAADEIERLWATILKMQEEHADIWSKQQAEIERLQNDLRLAVMSDSEECKMLEAENERLRLRVSFLEWNGPPGEANR